jgi:hydrogenase maturation factor
VVGPRAGVVAQPGPRWPRRLYLTSLPGHRRGPVAAALALLDKRLEVTDDDWRLSGRIMASSDATRGGVQRTLREQASEANIGRARAEAVRAAVVAEEVDALAVKKASQAVKTALSRQPGEWVAAGDLRRKVASRVRPNLDDALDALVLSGDIEAEATEYHGQSGTRYRLRG